jgi:hypothetical protein
VAYSHAATEVVLFFKLGGNEVSGFNDELRITNGRRDSAGIGNKKNRIVKTVETGRAPSGAPRLYNNLQFN